ncbi:syntaxin 17 isoform X2 [Anticarsia gemmatalis]|uniref:syntaxin 17 isoform X2 n=1 Tax=Anticarsia gemmatalis TaxID=129554 RepID=UPI003F7704A1
MDEENKLPLKRVEFSLSKFNEVAIPHHLDLLRQHKANIIKYEECGELARARTEQRHARRVAAQLRALLLELEALRRQVREQDRARFDSLTQRSRDTTLRAIVDYLGTSPLAIERNAREAPAAAASAASTDSVGVVAHVDPDAGPFADADQIQLRVDDQVSAGGPGERRGSRALTERLCRSWRCGSARRCCAAGASCRPRCARCTTCGSTRRRRRWRSASRWRPPPAAWTRRPTTWAPRADTWPRPRGCGRARTAWAGRAWARWWAARWGCAWAPRRARWRRRPARCWATWAPRCWVASGSRTPRPPRPGPPTTSSRTRSNNVSPACACRARASLSPAARRRRVAGASAP